eukprot:TRINITY_DN5432_c0_g1_i1.p1 TRINITY_DN5432_c0_g1~~TRINITY_DN5432_c0_g1_i1.p1  ORF type:complete len:607 (+),score=64.49 TRINITY_DN5432_c0_g1_i1:73-1893(+)
MEPGQPAHAGAVALCQEADTVRADPLRRERALGIYQRAVQLDPCCTRAHLALAELAAEARCRDLQSSGQPVLREAESFRAARPFYEAALHADSGCYQAHRAMAIGLFECSNSSSDPEAELALYHLAEAMRCEPSPAFAAGLMCEVQWILRRRFPDELDSLLRKLVVVAQPYVPFSAHEAAPRWVGPIYRVRVPEEPDDFPAGGHASDDEGFVPSAVVEDLHAEQEEGEEEEEEDYPNASDDEADLALSGSDDERDPDPLVGGSSHLLLDRQYLGIATYLHVRTASTLPDSLAWRVAHFLTWEGKTLICAGGYGKGFGTTQLSLPSDVAVNSAGEVFVCDKGNCRVQRWNPSLVLGAVGRVTTVAGGNGIGNRLDQLSNPVSIDVMDDDFVFPAAIFIADNRNNRILRWDRGATAGVAVASGVAGIESVVVDRKTGSLFIATYAGIMHWPTGARSATLVFADRLRHPRMLRHCTAGVYVADVRKDAIVTWPINGSRQRDARQLRLGKYYRQVDAICIPTQPETGPALAICVEYEDSTRGFICYWPGGQWHRAPVILDALSRKITRFELCVHQNLVYIVDHDKGCVEALPLPTPRQVSQARRIGRSLQ